MTIKEIKRLIEVQSKVLSIGEMLQNISHQWKQPLSLISSIASGIKMSKDFDTLTKEEEVKMLDKIIFI